MPMVEYTLDTLPKLTEERRKELAKLDALPVDQIDTSDIPELTDEQWAGAVRGQFYRPIKQQITARVDAAAVMVNASTAFTDGGEFGMGAEIGISTQKLHARGPMGLPELTSTKWVAFGDGHVRPA